MRPSRPGCGWSRSGRLSAATAHRLLDTYDAVLDALRQAWNALTVERIRSLTGYPICNRPRFRRAGMTLHRRARRRIGPLRSGRPGPRTAVSGGSDPRRQRLRDRRLPLAYAAVDAQDAKWGRQDRERRPARCPDQQRRCQAATRHTDIPSRRMQSSKMIGPALFSAKTLGSPAVRRPRGSRSSGLTVRKLTYRRSTWRSRGTSTSRAAAICSGRVPERPVLVSVGIPLTAPSSC